MQMILPNLKLCCLHLKRHFLIAVEGGRVTLCEVYGCKKVTHTRVDGHTVMYLRVALIRSRE